MECRGELRRGGDCDGVVLHCIAIVVVVRGGDGGRWRPCAREGVRRGSRSCEGLWREATIPVVEAGRLRVSGACESPASPCGTETAVFVARWRTWRSPVPSAPGAEAPDWADLATAPGERRRSIERPRLSPRPRRGRLPLGRGGAVGGLVLDWDPRSCPSKDTKERPMEPRDRSADGGVCGEDSGAR